MRQPQIAIVLLSFTFLVIIAIFFDLPFWLLPPEQKFAKSWHTDLKLLLQGGHFHAQLSELGDIEFSSNEPILQDWYRRTKSPFKIKKDGKFKLRIFAIHWIDGYRYGVILEYSWIDRESNNLIGEFARTLPLGVVY